MVHLLLKKYQRKFDHYKLIEETIEKGKDNLTRSLEGKKLIVPKVEAPIIQ